MESTIKEYSNSALAILDSLSKSITKESQSTRMYYYLLLVETRGRCYVPHMPDSPVLSVTDHYERENDKNKLIRSHYYIGGVYFNLHEDPAALSYFHKASDISIDSKSRILLERICSQMGTLFAYGGLAEEVLQTYRDTYHYL